MRQTKRAAVISAENDPSYSVRFEATFGSQFQRAVTIRNINRVLAEWKAVVKAQHKKNTITVTKSKIRA